MRIRHFHSTEPASAGRRARQLLVFGIALAATACLARQAPLAPGQSAILPGFWQGLWNGMIAPITFFVGLFSDTIRIYASPNAGWRYDLGFMIGIGGFAHGATNKRYYTWTKTETIRVTGP